MGVYCTTLLLCYVIENFLIESWGEKITNSFTSSQDQFLKLSSTGTQPHEKENSTLLLLIVNLNFRVKKRRP